MSCTGQFEINEADIVTLLPYGGDQQRAGWDNVGANSVHIHLQSNGDLIVQVHPRGNEFYPIREVTVDQEETIEAGGTDPDQ